VSNITWVNLRAANPEKTSIGLFNDDVPSADQETWQAKSLTSFDYDHLKWWNLDIVASGVLWRIDAVLQVKYCSISVVLISDRQLISSHMHPLFFKRFYKRFLPIDLLRREMAYKVAIKHPMYVRKRVIL
jgi:hypothetical protein